MRWLVKLMGAPLEATGAGGAADAIVVLGAPVRNDGSLSAVVEELSSMAADARTTIEIDLEETRGACAPELLHVVLQSLIGKAVKSLSGSERRLVRVVSRIELPPGVECQVPAHS